MDEDTTAVDNELLDLARARDFDALEAVWMKRLAAENVDLEELFRVARYLVKKHFDEHAGILLWSLIQSVSETAGAEAALAAAKRAAIIAPADKNLRDELIGLYHQARPDAIQLDDTLKAADLCETEDVKGALKFVEDFLHLQPGAYVVHRLSRRVGRVRGFDEQLYLIEAESSTYKHEPAEVLKQWQPLPRDDFHALAAFESDRLRRLAAEDVEQLFKLLLKTCNGRLEVKQAKLVLIPAVIAQEQWSKWWSSAKAHLKRSAWIEIGSGTQPTLAIRKQATGYA